MPYLKIYSWERDNYGRFRSISVEAKESIKYFRKLCRHFKTTPLLIVASPRYRDGGKYFGCGERIWYDNVAHIRKICAKDNKMYLATQKDEFLKGKIQIPLRTNLGTIVHEFAHHLTANQFGENQGHNKHFKRCLMKSYTFAKRWL